MDDALLGSNRRSFINAIKLKHLRIITDNRPSNVICVLTSLASEGKGKDRANKWNDLQLSRIMFLTFPSAVGLEPRSSRQYSALSTTSGSMVYEEPTINIPTLGDFACIIQVISTLMFPTWDL